MIGRNGADVNTIRPKDTLQGLTTAQRTARITPAIRVANRAQSLTWGVAVPPKIQFAKADLLRAAFRLTRQKGLTAVNARAIAKELGCSTQPIFRAFHSMDEIKGEVSRMAMDMYGLYITRSATRAAQPYLGTGLAYIAFAAEEPELFKILFMRDRLSDGSINDTSDKTLDYVLELVMENTGMSRERAMQFHRHLWIYTHGLASMIATKFITLEMSQIEMLLGEQYHAVRALYGLPPAED